MIQIDDAGSGSLIGGTCIGVLRQDTNEYHYEIVPVKYYNKANFAKKLYIYYTTDVVKNALTKLNASKEEPIFICQGYMFEDARKYLHDNGYKYYSTKIGDPLQTLVEKTFEEYTFSLGLPRDFILYTKYPFHFHRLLKWVYADYHNRVSLCKTGWKSWEKYSNLSKQIYYDKVLKSNYICLKCGKKIANNSDVKVIKFYSNQLHHVYIHRNCNCSENTIKNNLL
ncbi:MAG: hypothetical protein ACOZCL_04250 [Bacillota bacterium]